MVLKCLGLGMSGGHWPLDIFGFSTFKKKKAASSLQMKQPLVVGD